MYNVIKLMGISIFTCLCKGKDESFMKINKKFLAGVLAALMLTTTFSGCGKKAETNSGVTKVTVWRSNGHDKAFMQEKFKDFNDTVGKEKGINLEYVVKEGKLEEMLDVAYTSGQAPDLYNTYQIESRAQRGQIAALEDIKGSDELLKKFGGRAMEIRHKYKGKTYILPVTSGTYGLIYNTKMFIDAGIVDENGKPKPPVTWDDVVKDSKLLTNPSKQEYGMIFPGKWDGWYTTDINMASSASNGIVDGYNPQTGKFDYSAQIKVMDAMIRMKKDGSCVPGTEGMDNDPARARFGQGGIGMKIAGSYDVGVLKDQFPAKIEWGVAPLPVCDTESKGMQYCSADGMFAVNKESVDRIGADKIIAVLEYFSSDETLTDMYKEGLAMPADFNLVKDIKLPADLENWKTFASFVEFSHCPPLSIKSEMTGEKTINDVWLDIWNEAPDYAGIGKIVKDYENKQNAGIAKYKEIHPDYDASVFIISDWKLMR